MSIATIDQINHALPQIQCGLCGHPSCRPYAAALALGNDKIDRCAPGGVETLYRLAKLLHQDPAPYEAKVRAETIPPQRAVISESHCIGCTKCIQACPVSAILGAARQMHSIIHDDCTGCALCIEPCPMSCITMELIPEPSTTKKEENAKRACQNYRRQKERLARQKKKMLHNHQQHKLQRNNRTQTVQARQVEIKQALLRTKKKQSELKNRYIEQT